MTTNTLHLLWTISWQAAILSSVVWVISRLAKKAPAAWRYALWAMALAKFVIPPFAYLPEQLAVWNRPEPVKSAPVAVSQPSEDNGSVPSASASRIDARPDAQVTATQMTIPATTTAPTSSIAYSPMRSVDILTYAWLLGVIGMACVLGLRLARQRQMIRQALPVSESADALLADCARSLGMKRLPLVLQSGLAQTPMLVGVFRPIILLPDGMTEGCPESELRAMFLHELAHIKRHDMTMLWLYQWVQLAFFFNPALWLAGRELKRERELACDELVLASQSITRQDYAAGYISALKMAATSARAPISLAMAEPFEVEKRRLQMIMRHEVPKLTAGWLVALAILAVTGLPTFAGLAENETRPATVQTPDDTPTAAELISGVTEARSRALEAVKSGKGAMITVVGMASGPTQGFEQTRASSRVAFLGDRFSRVATIDKDTVAVAVCDGKTFVRAPGWQHKPTVMDASTLSGRMAAERIRTLFDVVGQTHPDMSKVLIHHSPEEARIVGREVVDGSECLILESRSVSQRPDSIHVDTRRLWIDPARGYVVPRLRVWSEGGIYKKRTLLSQTDATFRQYGQIWGPKSYEHVEYRLDSKTEQMYRLSRRVSEYAQDFALNVPVTDADLKPPMPKAGPSRVPARPLPRPIHSAVQAGAPAQPALPAVASRLDIPIDGRITRRFGYSQHPVTGQQKLHTGIDIQAPNGTPIKAVADGKAIKAGWYGAYGYAVIIDQGDGVATMVGHCSKLAVSEGQSVHKGEVIAYVGSTGYSTGPHLHFEERINGRPVNPLNPSEGPVTVPDQTKENADGAQS